MPTGVQGLDTILRGGLLEGGMYIVMGDPGTGKTILSNQIAFHHAGRGGRVFYVTLLAETHARMLAHLAEFSFFDSNAVSRNLNYVSAYNVLAKDGLEGLLEHLRNIVQKEQATLLVLDGLLSVEQFAESVLAYKRFLHGLQLYTNTFNCTTLLTTTVSPDARRGPEHSIVDGHVILRDSNRPNGALRTLEVPKLRGSASLRGRHAFEITDNGLVAYPRLDVIFRPRASATETAFERRPFGVQAIDDMLNGGLSSASSTVVIGSPGTGKTLLGMQFLSEGARRGERGLVFHFYEGPTELTEKSERAGIQVRSFVESGMLHLSWRPPVGLLLDAVAQSLFEALEKSGATRLFIDGFDAFRTALDADDRLIVFFSALANELFYRGVTTIFSSETENVVGIVARLPTAGISAMAENLLMMRYEELHGRQHRILSVVKLRESGYENAVRELHISDDGFSLGENPFGR